MPYHFKIMLIFWRLGLVDTFTMVQYFVNAGAQYGAIVLAAASGNVSKIGPKVLLEPIIGLGVSYDFIMAAQSAMERRKRVLTLAVFLANSISSILSDDPATNAALGAAVGTKLGYMRAMTPVNLLRGGSNQLSDFLIPSLKDFQIVVTPIKTVVVPPLLSRGQVKFHADCKLITENIFAEHTARRYVQGVPGLAKNFKIIEFSPAYLATIASTQLNTTAIIGWTCFGVGLISFTIFGALYLFQLAERKRYKVNVVTASIK